MSILIDHLCSAPYPAGMARPAFHGPAARGDATPVSAHHRAHLARDLMGISRELQFRVRHSLAEERGYHGLRPSFGPFLSLIWKEARPLRAAAEVLGISDQAASQLANLAEAAGYLERTSNPGDRRSRLVALTAKGHALAADGAGLILEIEKEVEALLGRATFREFAASLVDLYRGLGLDPALPPGSRRTLAVLTLLSERIQHDLMQGTIARGHPGLKMSYGQVIPLIGPDGARIRDIARIQRVSRQAISAITRELEKRGYLRSEPDPSDRRGTVLSFTRRGVSLVDAGVDAMEEVELACRDILGSDRLVKLRNTAHDLYRALDVETGTPLTGDEALRGVSGRSTRDIEDLSTRLRAWLGHADAARLAAELSPRSNMRTG